MAIGASSVSSSLYGVTPGSGTAAQNQAGIPLGLHGAASLGSGLRTGVRVVDHAIRVSTQLGEERERAREALEEQARLEAETAEAEEAARRDELRGRPGDDGGTSTASPAGGPDDDSTRQTIVAAVAAGQSGEETPRGAFVDFSV